MFVALVASGLLPAWASEGNEVVDTPAEEPVEEPVEEPAEGNR
ncbi:MAG: hypothetical protein M5U14_00915 [Acidimicrobiia bacterium]|nr:hypothetical protein [Acidimicrobiia bacterium]